MDDRDDLDDKSLVDDPIDDAVLAAAGRIQRCKWLAEPLADSVWVLPKRPHDELERRCRHFLGQLKLQSATPRAREDDLVRPEH